MDENAKKLLMSLEPYDVCACLINTANIKFNYEKVKNIVGDKVICAGVTKANSYGFGLDCTIPILSSAECKDFFVATIEEGIKTRNILRNINKNANIYILGGILKNTYEYFRNYDLTPVIASFDHLEEFIKCSKKYDEKKPSIVHVDTGMSRNGFRTDDIEKVRKIYSEHNLPVSCVMSHLACADDKSHPMNEIQKNKFEIASEYFHTAKKSLSSTNGVFLDKSYLFDMVRIGKAIYGFMVRNDLVGVFKPVIELYTKVIQVEKIRKGETVGYGATYIADRDMTVATLGIGYADGLMRKLSENSFLYLNGRKANILGRISMDFTVVDISDHDRNSIIEGDWACIVDDENTLEQLSISNATLPHEITCKLGSRVKKIYY